jgi:hypothetical protein
LIHLHEYARLLGYPSGKPLEGDVLARAEEAIAWYDRHGNPRVVTRVVGAETVAAITAGSEVEEEIAMLWAADRVDEAYFLDRLAAVVVEHLAASLGNGRSPGHKGFPLEEQSRLYALLEPPDVELLPSGMLKPVHSLLAVYGAEDASGSPCSRCDWRCTSGGKPLEASRRVEASHSLGDGAMRTQLQLAGLSRRLWRGLEPRRPDKILAIQSLRRCRLRLPHHQQLRRLPHHARAAR